MAATEATDEESVAQVLEAQAMCVAARGAAHPARVPVRSPAAQVAEVKCALLILNRCQLCPPTPSYLNDMNAWLIKHSWPIIITLVGIVSSYALLGHRLRRLGDRLRFGGERPNVFRII